MKKFFLIGSITLLSVFTVFLVSCDKEELSMQRDDTKDLLITKLGIGVDMVESEEYGTYLSLSSTETVDSILNTFLEEESKMDAWEETLGFTSMRTEQGANNTPFLDRYPDMGFATLLNPNGYIMVDNVLYHDTENAAKVYTVENGVEAIFSNSEPKRKSTCLKPDDTEVYTDLPCGSSNLDSRRLIGQIDIYNYWLSSKSKIILRTELYTKDCNVSNSESNWKGANSQGKIGFNFAFDVTFGPDAQNQSGIWYGLNQKYYYRTLAEGFDLCVGYIYGTHFAVHNGKEIRVFTRVE